MGNGEDIQPANGLWGNRKSPLEGLRHRTHLYSYSSCSAYSGDWPRGQAETEIQATLHLANLRFWPEAASTQRNKAPISNSSKGTVWASC